jgi:hypothetical protein
MRKCTYTLFLMLVLQHSSLSQAIQPGIYKPLDYYTCVLGHEKDTTRELAKKLTLAPDSTFIFQDITDCSCWFWQTTHGKWRTSMDTLILDWLGFRPDPDSVVVTTKYLISENRLLYSDRLELNAFKNWGDFYWFKPAICVLRNL